MTNRPVVPKVRAVAAAGAVATAVVAVLAAFGFDVPADVADEAVVGAAAIASFLAFLAGYLKRDPR